MTQYEHMKLYHKHLTEECMKCKHVHLGCAKSCALYNTIRKLEKELAIREQMNAERNTTMKEYTIVLTSEITMVAKMPDNCRINPTDFPKEKYEQAIKSGKLNQADFDDFKVTKMQVFDTTRKTSGEKICEVLSDPKLAEAVIREFHKSVVDDAQEESIGLTD